MKERATKDGETRIERDYRLAFVANTFITIIPHSKANNHAKNADFRNYNTGMCRRLPHLRLCLYIACDCCRSGDLPPIYMYAYDRGPRQEGEPFVLTDVFCEKTIRRLEKMRIKTCISTATKRTVAVLHHSHTKTCHVFLKFSIIFTAIIRYHDHK